MSKDSSQRWKFTFADSTADKFLSAILDDGDTLEGV
jgi:hypothetical protein